MGPTGPTGPTGPMGPTNQVTANPMVNDDYFKIDLSRFSNSTLHSDANNNSIVMNKYSASGLSTNEILGSSSDSKPIPNPYQSDINMNMVDPISLSNSFNVSSQQSSIQLNNHRRSSSSPYDLYSKKQRRNESSSYSKTNLNESSSYMMNSITPDNRPPPIHDSTTEQFPISNNKKEFYSGQQFSKNTVNRIITRGSGAGAGAGTGTGAGAGANSGRIKTKHPFSKEVNNQPAIIPQPNLLMSSSSSPIPPPPPPPPSTHRSMPPVQTSIPLLQPTIPLSVVTFKKSDLLTFIDHFSSIPRPEIANSSQLYVDTPIPTADLSRIIIERKKVDVHNKPIGALVSPNTNDVKCYLIPTNKNELNAPHAVLHVVNQLNSSNSYLFSYNLPIKE